MNKKTGVFKRVCLITKNKLKKPKFDPEVEKRINLLEYKLHVLEIIDEMICAGKFPHHIPNFFECILDNIDELTNDDLIKIICTLQPILDPAFASKIQSRARGVHDFEMFYAPEVLRRDIQKRKKHHYHKPRRGLKSKVAVV